MALFNKKKNEPPPKEMKQYITGAGGTIVSKSILEGTSKLKWLFRENSEYGNGWVALGDTDTQEYVDNPDNMTIVDFNTLANIEPAVVNVFYMPVGSDLELCSDPSGNYFLVTRDGKEIREPVKHPVQLAFEKNLKFLNQNNYPAEFFQGLFQTGGQLETFIPGNADFPTGEVVLADPLAYLGGEYATYLDRKVPAGSYPLELAVLHSELAGLRIAAARLIVSDSPAVRYEIAMPKDKKPEELGQPGVWTLFGVDTGLACCTDVKIGEEYRDFFAQWHKENPGKNRYDDYFAALFEESRRKFPHVQNQGGSFLSWQLPRTGHHVIMFASGMGDGIYSAYWGLDSDGEVTELIMPFMNPEFF